MKPDCILLYGLSSLPGAKHAGPFRIASELRKHGYSVQCIDLTMFEDVDLLLDIVNHLTSEKTLWLGISSSFLNRPSLKDPGQFGILLEKLIKNVKDLYPDLQLIAGGNNYLNFSQKYKIFIIFSNLNFICFKGILYLISAS